jgi:hypothetical protein
MRCAFATACSDVDDWSGITHEMWFDSKERCVRISGRTADWDRRDAKKLRAKAAALAAGAKTARAESKS